MKPCFFIFLAAIFSVCYSCIQEPDDLSVKKLYKSGNLKLGDTITLSYHATFYDEQNILSLTFDTVLTDCRCPEGCMCCWQGNVEVRMTFKIENNSFPFTIDSYFVQDTILENYHFHLVNVAPYPTIEQTIEPSEYSVQLVVTQ